MNQQRLFRRKVIYFSAIALLLFPLWWLSQPATTTSEGGRLAQLRHEYQLSQADLGKIDPTSASMKLATFGMHGVAANILWSKAIDYKDREDFTNFDATLQQITYLQPHFVKVWDFQGHNVAFNISVEFDDYRDRYHYVIKGFRLLEKGLRYNEKSAKLIRALAHYTGFKIGRSDEKKFYRVLYRNDDDYHAPPRSENWLLGTRYEHRPQSLRDNWLVSQWWYREAEKLVDGKVITYGTMNPFLLHSDPARQQMEYAENLEVDGHFGEIAKTAWQKAADDWKAFGQRLIPSTRGFEVRLADFQKYGALQQDLARQIDDLQPGLREELLQRASDGLSEAERAAQAKPQDQRSQEEEALAAAADNALRITPLQVANAVAEDLQPEAQKLAERYRDANLRFRMIERYRNTVNFDYWERRCEIEQLPEAIAARQAIYEAKAAYRETDLPTAQDQFEQGIALWAKVIDQYPLLLEEETQDYDLMEMIREGYQVVLAQTREDGSTELPDDFPLQHVVDLWQTWQKETPAAVDSDES